MSRAVPVATATITVDPVNDAPAALDAPGHALLVAPEGTQLLLVTAA